MSGTVIVRTAGLPIRHWLSAANPSLFAELRDFGDADDSYRARCRRLANRIGHELIPRDDVSGPERAVLLAVRRQLHRGDPFAPADLVPFLSLAASLPGITDRFRGELCSIGDRSVEHAKRRADLSRSVQEEVDRLLVVPDVILAGSPIARALPDMAQASSEAHRPRERRRRADLAWRRIQRGSVETTPRDWLGHVAIASVTQTRTGELVARPRFATHWIENVRTHRRRLAQPAETWPAEDSAVAQNPLHWSEGDQLVTLVVDHHAEPTRISVRHTPLLGEVCRTLADGPRRYGEIARAIHDASGLELSGFVRHLTTLGILEAGGAPSEQFCAHAPVDRLPSDLDGRLDVYRFMAGSLSLSRIAAIEESVVTALHLFGIAPRLATETHLPDGEWPFSDVLRSRVERGPSTPDAREVEHSLGAGDDRLLQFLRNQIAHAGDEPVVDIGRAALEATGIGRPSLDWPVDCLIGLGRLRSEVDAVLDQVRPAAVLDARFASTLSAIHGSLPHEEFYRTFLADLEERTGMRFVEILAPPLADGAANAIRRPSYTEWWTGDPNPDPYFGAGPRPSRYAPFDAIRIRRVSGRLYADVDGVPIWPIYHATRSFSPPWDRLARVLLAAAPDVLPWSFRASESASRLVSGQRRTTPRITVDGRLVVAPGTWRLGRRDAWDSDAPLVAKARTLDRIRARRGLPRWVSIGPIGADSVTACDLESLHAIRILERAFRAGPVLATEILPAPDQLLIRDGGDEVGDRLASHIQIRLPVLEEPRAMADRVSRSVAIGTRTDSRGHAGQVTVTRVRDPPRRQDMAQSTRLGHERDNRS